MDRRILIIDDEKNILIPMTDYFEDMGWTVFPFTSAEEALIFLEREKVSCAIIDVRLNGMTGLDFIYETRRRKYNMHFIIYTGSMDFIIPEDFINFGVSSENVIMKPAPSFSVIYNAVLNNCCKGGD
jgi:DNA-binding NtrC family response regulator